MFYDFPRVEKVIKYKKLLTKNEFRFLKTKLIENVEPFATFYTTMKVHKSPLKTRPIVSCSGSLLEALGVWVDDKLQIAAQRQRSYFKNSLELKQNLTTLDIPPNAFLFTADAESMYTNIPTHRALMLISRYLRNNVFEGIPVKALMEALRLVMTNNIFTFGDTIWKQKTGTAMGTPPAPPWATLFYALCEETFLDTFADNLINYSRYIDDVFGIWVPTSQNNDNWRLFKMAMNNPTYRLTWIISDLSQQVDFMDLTILIKNGKIQTTLYEKSSCLHLYIPPHSCHPHGLLPGVVHGQINRIMTLCTDPADQKQKTVCFFRHLQRRGFQPRLLHPLFQRALHRANNRPENPTDKPAQLRKKMRKSILFHMRYHPSNPPSREIQKLWSQHVDRPPYCRPLAEIKNSQGHKINIDRLIVAYNRPLNLGNLLSYRKLYSDIGPPASSFMD